MRQVGLIFWNLLRSIKNNVLQPCSLKRWQSRLVRLLWCQRILQVREWKDTLSAFAGSVPSKSKLTENHLPELELKSELSRGHVAGPRTVAAPSFLGSVFLLCPVNLINNEPIISYIYGFPDCSEGKESVCSSGDAKEKKKLIILRWKNVDLKNKPS